MTQYLQPRIDSQPFLDALVDYIRQGAAANGLYKIAADELSGYNWSNDAMIKLVNSTVEFYEYLTTVRNYSGQQAFSIAIENCSKAGMAASIIRQGLHNRLTPEYIPMFNDAAETLADIDRDIQQWKQNYNRAVVSGGRAHLYASSNHIPPAVTHAPPTAVHNRYHSGLNQQPTSKVAGVTGGWGFRRDAINQPNSTTPSYNTPVVDNRQKIYDAAPANYPVQSPAAIPPAHVKPVDCSIPTAKSTKESLNMNYETHRLTAISQTTSTSRQARNLDEFMGSLTSNIRTRQDELTEDTDAPLVISPNEYFAAFGTDMAIFKASGLVASGGTQQILEFEYLNVKPVYQASGSAIAAAEVNVPHLTKIRQATCFHEAFKILNDYVTNRPVQDKTYSIADRIINEVNNRITEAVNRLLAFSLYVTERIDDFAMDWGDLYAMLTEHYCDFDELLTTPASAILQRCTRVAGVDVDSEEFSDLNTITNGALSVAVASIEHVSVTLMPMMACELNMAIGVDFTYIVPTEFPKMYRVLDAIEGRLESKHYYYDRIYVIFEDGVKLEVVYTDIPVDDSDENTGPNKIAIRKVVS